MTKYMPMLGVSIFGLVCCAHNDVDIADLAKDSEIRSYAKSAGLDYDGLLYRAYFGDEQAIEELVRFKENELDGLAGASHRANLFLLDESLKRQDLKSPALEQRKERRRVSESAGINRLGIENERVLQRKPSCCAPN